MKGWQFYGVKGLQVCPYMPGVPVYQDAMLGYLYKRIKADGNVEATFCGEHKTIEQFVTYIDRIKTMQVLCTVAPDGTAEPRGFSWLDNAKGVDGCRAAMPGFAFFKGSSAWSRDLCRLGLGYWMHDLRINVLHGWQLASNTQAKNFAKKLGFQEICTIPDYHFSNGKLEAARVMILRDTDFLPKFWDWKKQRDTQDLAENAVAIEA